MEPLRELVSRTVVLEQDDIDTDQIIPARFLTTTTREGLGRHLFNDWRFLADGTPNPGFVLNRPEAADCRVLVAGNNFGCGSSREHAPWALLDYGFRAVISTEIADIFRGNALKNGLLPIVVDAGTHRWLVEHPGEEVAIDVAASTLTLPDGTCAEWPLDGFARYCLLEGIDSLGFLRQHGEQIEAYERSRPWTP